jgi:Zn-dependent protease
MFLLEPERTQFDLSWRMFGVSIRVHPMFWLISGIFGWNILKYDGFGPFGIFIACMFVSVLVHELGHVFMNRLFGRESHVVLYAFGGMAISYRELPDRWQRIAVSLAGPGAGFLLCGAAWLFLQHAMPRIDPNLNMELLWEAAAWLYFINLFLNLLNLLPIWPLDGGKVSREICTWLSPRTGVRLSLGVSFVLAGLLAVLAISAKLNVPTIPFLWFIYGTFTALFFVLFAVQSFQLLQQESRPPWREDWPDQWRR